MKSNGGAAFLLAQVGAYATQRFAERLSEHDLTPPQAGILRLLRATPGISQQQLAEQLGILPSRVVVFVDELEQRGLIRRETSSADRRVNLLQLTDAGEDAYATLGSVGRRHEADICSSLTDREHEQLIAMLSRIASQQGLTPGVHPGYRAAAPTRRRP